jgi:multidrug transporter EmrE-like cation transporter
MADNNMQMIAGLTLLSTAGDFSLKNYSLGKQDNGALIGAAAYGGIVFILSQNLGRQGVAWSNNMWNAGTSIVETAIAMWVGEELTNVNLAGVALIILGAILLNTGREI